MRVSRSLAERHNVVLVHGLLGTAAFSRFDGLYFRNLELEKNFPDDDIKHIQPKFDEGGCEAAGRKVLRKVEEALNDGSLHNGRPIHFICHSQGGLNTRWALHLIHTDPGVSAQFPCTSTLLKSTEFTHTYTSIGTPHLGTRVADIGLRFFRGFASGHGPQLRFDRSLRLLGNAVSRIIGGDPDSLAEIASWSPHLAEACASMATTSAAMELNRRAAKHPRVNYHCIASCGPIAYNSVLKAPSLLLSGPNDGVVSFDSAEWGGAARPSYVMSLTDKLHGWKELNHVTQVGHKFDALRFISWPLSESEKTDHQRRYKELLDFLIQQTDSPPR
jgi:hypothetical protein